ncbi:hypothetical protein MNBD_NITROSPINAE02-1063 [hydrothermal vent metagenome]|uniref:Permease often clustered with de novo purine synthesis n=1 Tax=hydrothermal vent metagenome TaxID=652676 RepID=A0A3B1BUU7_9ZZZZ
MNDFLIRPTGKGLFAFAALVFFLWFVYVAGAVLFPFAVAFGLAYILDPLIDRMEKLKMSRSFAIFLALFSSLLVLIATVSLIAPLIWAQVETLTEKIPEYIKYVEEKGAPWVESVPNANKERVIAVIEDAMKSMGDLPVKILKSVTSGVWSGLSNLIGFLIFLFNLVIIPVASFYLLKDFDKITQKIEERIPPRNRPFVKEFCTKVDNVLSDFFRGQLMIASIMASILSVGLFFIGTPMGLAIGLLAGMANIVPYLSIVLGLVPALIMTYLEFQDLSHLVMVALLFGGAQALEGFVITPRTLEKAVGLHPVAVMAALLVGANFFGFLGLLLAVPSAAAIKVALFEMDTAYLESDFFKSEE